VAVRWPFAGSPIREFGGDWHTARGPVWPGPVSADADPGIDRFGTACFPCARISHQREVLPSPQPQTAAEVRKGTCIADQTRHDASPLIRDGGGRAQGVQSTRYFWVVGSFSSVIIAPTHGVPRQPLSMPCSMLLEGVGLLLAAQSL
jgi:hypothetical protein